MEVRKALKHCNRILIKVGTSVVTQVIDRMTRIVD
jgi:hypothetical protein